MKALSRLALELYRACRELPVGEFQLCAMDRLRVDLPFDAGKWVSGHMEGTVPVVHSVKLLNRPAQMHADYERIRQHDYLAKESVANVDKALVFNDIGERPESSPELRAYLDKWRTAHSMVCARIDPFTDLATGIAIWRERLDQPYIEAERRRFEAAVPHLIESYAINRITHVVRVTQPRSAALYASAITDEQGRLQVAPVAFQNLLRAEWPGWRGNRLPGELAPLFAGGEAPRHVGRKVFVRAARVQELVLVQVRQKRAADELTPRELQVARLASAGLSYRQVAARLAISAATVRTHLSAVYGKLAVHKQAELLALLEEVR